MKERKSNIELLRIVAILLIISFHYVYKGGFVFEDFSFNKFTVKTFYMFGELGVNLFILITGYFMCKSNFSFKKLIYLILEVNFYYLLSMLIACKLEIKTITTAKDFFLTFFPTILNRYWFVTAYIIVYILVPYLNILINNMDKDTYKKCLITALLLWCVIPTVFGIFFNSTETMVYYSRLIWLIIMYFVGAYIRIHSIKIINTPKKAIKVACIVFVMMLLSILFIEKFSTFFGILGTTETAYFWTPNSILMFLLSISIFKIFLEINISYNDVINKLASTTLGIYMIHDGVLNTYIWEKIFRNSLFIDSPFLIFHIIMATITIFIVGAYIDLVRQFIEKHTVKKFLDSKVIEKFSNKMNILGKKIYDFI